MTPVGRVSRSASFFRLPSVSHSDLDEGVEGQDRASRSPSHAHAVLSPGLLSRPPPQLSARPADAIPDADNAPAVALLTETLREAAARGASDIHVEPGEHEWRIRLRIDGALHVFLKPPPHLRDAFITRIKVLARMDIAERRVPQDGRLRLPLANGIGRLSREFAAGPVR